MDITNYNKLKDFLEYIEEIYQEDGASTFTHENKIYNLNKLLRIVETYNIVDFKVSELIWIFKYSSPQPGRKHKPDLSVPIIIIKWGNKYVTVDGLHRLEKAKKLNNTTIPVKIITQKDLDMCYIKDRIKIS